ncbi:hypothetical protein [Lentisalinibacter sediminis]|uniref:hypothetical protein n=1 Tax=Lentisalinibacter sediminis TaxID=2992237 RepID=UPI00386E9D4A
MEEHWIQLDPRRLRGSLKLRRGSERERARPSPYDVPEAIRVCRDSEQQRYSMQFVYIGDEEPSKEVRGIGDVEIRIGEHSGRLQSIEIVQNNQTDEQVGTTEADRALERLTQAIDRLIETANRDQSTKQRIRSVTNYRLARDAVAENREELAHATG